MSVISGLMPAPMRRTIVDWIYGSKSSTGMLLYFAALALLWIMIAAWATGKLTDWPLKVDGKVEHFEGDTCEEMAFARYREPLAPGAVAPPADEASSGGATICSQLGPGQRLQLERAQELGENLRQGTPTQMADFEVAEESALRAWMDGNVCRLGGAADGADRARLGWYVRRGVGKCGGWSKLIAGFPVTVWLGFWAGLLLTPLLVLAAAYYLLRHALRIPSTRSAYRRLYGSEHKPPFHGSEPRAP
jgi:hypothetical protein